MVLTHVCDDHIGGFKAFLEDSQKPDISIDRYWINYPELIDFSYPSKKKSVASATTLLETLQDRNEIEKCKQIYIAEKNTEIDLYDLSFTILSPDISALEKVNTKIADEVRKRKLSTDNQKLRPLNEIYSEPESYSDTPNNRASIALLVESNDKSILLLGDSDPRVITEALSNKGYSSESPLEVDFVKVSHHGSRNNTDKKLLSLIKCKNFIFSTNGGHSRSNHPHRETLAKILCSEYRCKEIDFFFNYSVQEIENRRGPLFLEDEMGTYNFTIHTISQELVL